MLGFVFRLILWCQHYFWLFLVLRHCTVGLLSLFLLLNLMVPNFKPFIRANKLVNKMVKLKFGNYFLNKKCKLNVIIMLSPFLKLADSIFKLLDRVAEVIKLSIQVFLQNNFILFLIICSLLQFGNKISLVHTLNFGYDKFCLNALFFVNLSWWLIQPAYLVLEIA